MELENEENVKHRNTPKDLFDAWAIQGKDEVIQVLPFY